MNGVLDIFHYFMSDYKTCYFTEKLNVGHSGLRLREVFISNLFFENVIKRIFDLFIILTITFCQSTFIATCESQEKAKKTLLEYGSYLVSQVIKVCCMHR